MHNFSSVMIYVDKHGSLERAVTLFFFFFFCMFPVAFSPDSPLKGWILRHSTGRWTDELDWTKQSVWSSPCSFKWDPRISFFSDTGVTWPGAIPAAASPLPFPSTSASSPFGKLTTLPVILCDGWQHSRHYIARWDWHFIGLLWTAISLGEGEVRARDRV